jgi:hypothetical protein
VNRQLDFVVEAADRMEGEIGELMVGPSSREASICVGRERNHQP